LKVTDETKMPGSEAGSGSVSQRYGSATLVLYQRFGPLLLLQIMDYGGPDKLIRILTGQSIFLCHGFFFFKLLEYITVAELCSVGGGGVYWPRNLTWTWQHWQTEKERC
jgi:hypothetical protein